jgi:hypothetical protein
MKCFDGMACMMPGDCVRVGKCLVDSAAVANAADWKAWCEKRARRADYVQRLRRALADRCTWIQPKDQTCGCDLCGSRWKNTEPEAHRPDCLLAEEQPLEPLVTPR